MTETTQDEAVSVFLTLGEFQVAVCKTVRSNLCGELLDRLEVMIASKALDEFEKLRPEIEAETTFAEKFRAAHEAAGTAVAAVERRVMDAVMDA